jgi:hypothetical protein
MLHGPNRRTPHRVAAQCPRCGAEHTGGQWNCSDCSICCRWHEGDECFDLSVTQRCRLCGEQHLTFIDCPCAICLRFHSGKDCLPFHATDGSVCNIEGSATVRARNMERSVPCPHCNAWHAPSKSCAHLIPVGVDWSLMQPVIFIEEAENSADTNSEIYAPVIHTIGSMTIVCPHCQARFWPDERINCCFQGSLILQEQSIPKPFQDCILSAEVLSHIRQYNMAMSMASVGHKNASLPDGTFILSGKSYHRIGPLVPFQGNLHNFAQIYILDTMDATSRRMDVFAQRLKASVLSNMHDLMLMHNPYARQYRQAAIDDVELQWSTEDDILGMQIGAIIAEPGHSRTIIIRKVTSAVNKLTFIDDAHHLYHTLAYPLLFPTGAHGWHANIMRVLPFSHQLKKVSLTDYFRHLLMHRSAVTHIQRCQRLSLELYCDAWAQVEARAMMFHRNPAQQAKYRVGRKCAIDDQLQCEGGDLHAASIPLILPASFVGSSKWYHMLYMDAMSLPMRFNKPDLFITMTCNPRWPEIQAAVPHGSHWRFHPDLVARVFWLKFKSMMKDIIKLKIFGEVRAYVWRIEWQARGLPHVHLLIILVSSIVSTQQVDDFVSAEIPDPAKFPILHDLIANFQLHTPCDVNEDSGCRQGKPCKRHFPKDMSRSTVIINNAFPKYRRRGLHFCDVNGRLVGDDWVVPHNPYLTLKYRCHINVEIATSIKSFKYVYKYGAHH